MPQNYQEALKWYRLAAAQGDSQAQYNVAWMYFNGHGVTQDYQEALKWYRLAAAQGDSQAQYNLGSMYGNGQGVPPDYVRAHMWSNLASAVGIAEGTRNRDAAAMRMTPQQIQKAQDMARKCRERNFKGC